jgi:hypothetical protein
MKLRIPTSMFLLLLLPAFALAQKPAEPATAHDAQILWEFDTGG